MQDLTSRDFWNTRATDPGHPGILSVFVDWRAPYQQRMVEDIFNLYKDMTVLEVGCGYGRFAKVVPKYEGFDFSEEMIKKANNLNCFLEDARTFIPQKKYDIIFEVICLSSLKQTPKEFNERWKAYAEKFVICFEPDTISIFPIYKHE